MVAVVVRCVVAPPPFEAVIAGEAHGHVRRGEAIPEAEDGLVEN